VLAPRVLFPLLAQTTSQETSSSIEFDLPYLPADWLPFGLLLVGCVVAIWLSLRDTRTLGRAWGLWLGLLRFGFLAIAIVIALNPHERTQTDVYRPSRVLLLVDTSTSMQQPATDENSGSQSRLAAVQQLLESSELIKELRAQHEVDIHTFDSDVSDVKLRLPTTFSPNEETPAETESTDAPAEWAEILNSDGHLTRLGDSLDKLLVEAKSPTLSGVIVISDGASNAGRDVVAARKRAQSEGVRLVAVGVGSTTPPVNLELTKLISPTEVQKGDEFELSAIVTGQGVAGKQIDVDLLQQGPNDPEPVVVKSEQVSMPAEGPLEYPFDLKPADAGKYEYQVRVSVAGESASRTTDNQQSRQVFIFDRPLRILMIAGGPMRDYRFAKNTLYRQPSTQVDIWLQTGDVGISQESNRLLFNFPENKEELYVYDAIVAFDPDWSVLTLEQMQLLTNWVSEEGGGIFAVAGDIHTPELARDEELSAVRTLYPVQLDEISLTIGNQERADVAYPVGFTEEGATAEFLKLAESGEDPAWTKFAGVYRCYPTRGVKAGTTVYAEFTDPLSRGPGGQPALIAGQRYGLGNVLYLGSPEIWRLRAINESYFDRFWIKAVRKASEGRSKRGLQRSLFIVDSREFELGQTIPLRVRALNPQFEPLNAEEITLDLYGPNDVPILPGPKLIRDRFRPAEYVGEYRPTTPGRYRFEFKVPDSNEKITLETDVKLPRQEAASLVQEVGKLKSLVEGTGGAYVSLQEAPKKVPAMLESKGQSVPIDQQIDELWDRQWLMILMALILGAEWLTRKLLKLA